MPSARDGAPWHDIEFTYEAICTAPDAVLTCVQALVDAAGNPLLTMSKSGGPAIFLQDTGVPLPPEYQAGHVSTAINKQCQQRIRTNNMRRILKFPVREGTLAGMHGMKS